VSRISKNFNLKDTAKDIKDQRKSRRMPLHLGKVVKFVKKREVVMDDYVYVPPWNKNQTESIYIHGSNRSGKTGLALNIALQSYLLEGRSWIFIDNKGSYAGAWNGNYEFEREIQSFGLYPVGFPTEDRDGETLMVISEPYYNMNMQSATEIKASYITHPYKVPIKFLNLQLMCELTAINIHANYVRRFDDVRKKMYAEVPNPTLSDLSIMLEEIIEKTKGNVKNLYRRMKEKIEEEGKFSIKSSGAWSSVGEQLMSAAFGSKPKFIVMTFRHSDSPFDPRNSACYTALLEEIKLLSTLAKRNQWNLKLGIIVDELYYYTRKSGNDYPSSWVATHDLLYNWGASNRVMRIFATQRDVQLDKEFSDSIKNRKYSSTYAYDIVFHTRKIPRVGYASVLDRLHPIESGKSTPKYIDNVKLCPPLCSSEKESVTVTS
jgi:hypothetical protein